MDGIISDHHTVRFHFLQLAQRYNALILPMLYEWYRYSSDLCQGQFPRASRLCRILNFWKVIFKGIFIMPHRINCWFNSASCSGYESIFLLQLYMLYLSVPSFVVYGCAEITNTFPFAQKEYPRTNPAISLRSRWVPEKRGTRKLNKTLPFFTKKKKKDAV